ncbi:DUF1499 domain-containing protein [Maritimibacter sp. DP1N21-5]|uniref:DUF1499 domain-containing protein n=1 Tax=Maritimibacter sp. DP1N21-5 TaxID=2836867 RepID=UPI001C44EAB3|nr:DUF1499 domain-containing protein [Maritimibacter sp. DP1N21-5]MBV7409755.1 DUF1499 domain-containing protein [Maritimibacter sp. DP1N21-5]
MGLRIVLGLVLLLVIAGAWVRFAPLPQGRLTATPGPDEPGAHKLTGGIKLVVPLDTLPPDAFDRLLEVAAATPRTERIGEGRDPAAFVTRSKLWRFPDIATIWQAEGNLHVYSHLVFGQGDMGVNAAKVTRWMQALEAGGDA